MNAIADVSEMGLGNTKKELHGSPAISIEGNTFDDVKALSFPAKLHAILLKTELSDIISWMPHGRSWRVHKPKSFESEVIPLFFVHCKYSSFIRQANGWGFQRITRGQDRNSYYNKFFLRGQPQLCQQMRRPAKSRKVPVDPENEPDFYRMSKLDPLCETVSSSAVLLVNNEVVPSLNTNKCLQEEKKVCPCQPIAKDTCTLPKKTCSKNNLGYSNMNVQEKPNSMLPSSLPQKHKYQRKRISRHFSSLAETKINGRIPNATSNTPVPSKTKKVFPQVSVQSPQPLIHNLMQNVHGRYYQVGGRHISSSNQSDKFAQAYPSFSLPIEVSNIILSRQRHYYYHLLHSLQNANASFIFDEGIGQQIQFEPSHIITNNNFSQPASATRMMTTVASHNSSSASLTQGCHSVLGRPNLSFAIADSSDQIITDFIKRNPYYCTRRDIIDAAMSGMGAARQSPSPLCANYLT